jgi:hypothetical protein
VATACDVSMGKSPFHPPTKLGHDYKRIDMMKWHMPYILGMR